MKVNKLTSSSFLGLLIIIILIMVTMFEKGQQYSCSKPSDLLGFTPVDSSSDSFSIRIAQAEIQRHEVSVGPAGVDGEWGPGTAYGQAELLVKIQNGYKIHSIYEKPK